MKGYVYGVKECTHYFCPTCGSSLFVDPHVDDEMAANVRMFRDIDVDKLVLWKYDGFKVPPRYEV